MNIGMEQDISLELPFFELIFSLEGLLSFVFWIIVLILAFSLSKRLAKKILKKGRYLKHTVFLIRLPKEKPGEDKTEPTVDQIREDISLGETLFSAIGGLKAQRGFKYWLLGRDDHFSFEIVAYNKKIHFYVVAPADNARYIEQQISAHYPEASIEEVEDYNIFTKESRVSASILKTKRSFIFPLRTYSNMEADPMNSIVNAMSKLQDGEAVAVQVLARSAKGDWHSRVSKVVREVKNGKSLKEAMSSGSFKKTMNFIGSVAKDANPSKKEEAAIKQPESNVLSAKEEEMVKGFEEKNAKAGLDVNVRVIVSARSDSNAKVYLNNMNNAFAEYNYYEYGNSFKYKIRKNSDNIIKSFIYRSFEDAESSLLNTEELASIYHFPLRIAETPNILWLTARHAPAPSNIPEEGVLLGHNHYRGVSKEIRIKRNDRRRHMYIIGKSGGGKSVFMASMAVQDILNGEGVCVMDPHGDLVETILKRVPPERAEDVILFSPSDTDRPMGLNLIEFDQRYPEQKTFVINELIKIFDKLYDLKSTGGPMFEQYMRNALLLIMAHPESGSTLMEVPKVLADPAFRKMKLDNCPDMTVVDFWKEQAEKAGGEAALANVVPYVTSKLTQFVSNDTMRPIIGQQKSAFNFRDIMDKQKILLIDLSKGKIGEMNAYLLGLIIVGKILMASLSRTDMPEEKRKDFYLYIDEFQNFTTDSISTILSEARKYGLNLTIAHQYLGQLSQSGQDTGIKDAVFGNVGSWVLLKIGSEDAEVLEKEFSPTFNQYDLINIEAHTAYAKLLIDGTASKPFSMKTVWPIPGVEREGVSEKVRNLSRLKYGQDRSLIEAEITKRIRGYNK
ncbi:type IV secretion system DNA-binding domain-containing protein [Candidatus Falkowbacteria bacterium]|nr:type IV secretion system DNA-binding domain-containing protein [Candidatus Falkowbacteria bacterium]